MKLLTIFRARCRISFATILFAGCIVVPLCSDAKAQAPALWGELKPGPFKVGYRPLYRLDRSRVWNATPDSIRQGEFARPIRISLWYPATAADAGSEMIFADYVHFRAPDRYFASADSMLEARETASWKNAFKGVESRYPQLLKLSVAARRNATPAAGPFPLVMYSEGWNSSSQNDNSVLAEFLASHGYVVASVPQLGTTSGTLTLGLNPIDLETQMRDIEFAMGAVQEETFVDRNKLALMGWSMGGVVSLWLAARNPNVDAVIGLDASFRARSWIDMVIRSPYFDIRQIRVPILALQSGNAKYVDGQDDRVVDSLHFAERYVGRVAHITHGDFSDFAMVASLFPVHLEDRTAAQASRGHVVVARQTLAFLDATLRGNQGSLARLRTAVADSANSSISLTYKEGARISSEADWVTMLDTAGFDATLARYQQVKRKYPALSVVRFAVLNRLAYGLRDAGKPDLAVSVFRLNAAAYPLSADAHDSLADGYIAKGDSASARQAYEQVLSLLAADTSLSAESKADYRSRAETYLRAHPAKR